MRLAGRAAMVVVVVVVAVATAVAGGGSGGWRMESKQKRPCPEVLSQLKRGDWAFLGARRVERKGIAQLALRMPWLLG